MRKCIHSSTLGPVMLHHALILIVAVALFPARVWAVSPDGTTLDAGSAFRCIGESSAVQQQGEQLLAQAQKRYEGSGTIRARFLQRSYLSAVDLTESSSGEVIFQKPGRMKWHYQDPQEQVFLVRDETLWLHQVAERQVLVDSFRSVLLSDLPVSFIMGLGNLVDRFSFESFCRSNAGIVVTLRPKDEGASGDDQLQRFRLLLAGSDREPRGAEVTDVVGNVTTIVLLNPTTTPAATEAEFSAVFPKGTDIIDQRARS